MTLENKLIANMFLAKRRYRFIKPRSRSTIIVFILGFVLGWLLATLAKIN